MNQEDARPMTLSLQAHGLIDFLRRIADGGVNGYPYSLVSLGNMDKGTRGQLLDIGAIEDLEHPADAGQRIMRITDAGKTALSLQDLLKAASQ